MSTRLNISIDGESIDLNPGSVMEIQEENPFLQLNDELKGDYSFPIEVPMTETNQRIFRHIQLLTTPDKSRTLDRVIVSDGIEQLIGVLRKEQVAGNLNFVGTDALSLYFLKGSSHFFKDVEGKNLADCNYGPDRSFAFEYHPSTFNNDYLNNSFFRHIHEVMSAGSIDTYDYAVYTVYNDSSEGNGNAFVELQRKSLNFFIGDPVNHRPQLRSNSNYAVFPYLNYVLKAVFESFGWQVDGFVFDDPDFKRATLINTALIDYTIRPNGRVNFNLKNHVPFIKIPSFLIALRNRFGWWYDFNYGQRKCTIRRLNDVFSGNTRHDITRYVNAGFTLKVNPTKKYYALVQSTSPDAPDVDQWDYKGALSLKKDLPSPSVATSGYVYFVATENKFYICTSDVEDETVYIWDVLTENDFSFVPKNKTDEVSTSCSIPRSRVTNFGTLTSASMATMAIPEVSLQDDNADTDTFYVCFHFGLRPVQMNDPGPGYTYAQGGASAYSYSGAKETSFAMNYRYFEPVTGQDIGNHQINWEAFLSRLNQEETIEITASLPQLVALGIKWQDTILINNAEYILQSRQKMIPYNNEVKLTLVRV